MGNILRRIAAKVICKVKKEDFNHYLAPHQKGTQKGGSEQIVHSVRAAIERNNLPTNWVLAKIDLKNAFNLVSREQVLFEVATHSPSIYKWVKYMLGSASYLNWSDEVIESAVGVQQGDPLAPVLFCMVLKKVINAISDSCALDINLWFLDDGVIAGPAEEVSRALDVIEQVGPKLGLYTNLSKKDGGIFCTDEIILDSFQQFSHRSQKFNFPLLGVPIGELDYCNQYALDLVKKVIKDTHEPISNLQDPQAATLLLRKCASFCKLVFLARATPINYINNALSMFDNATLTCFEKCVGFPLASEAARLQAQLSTKSGGVGLRSTLTHSSAAYVASAASFGPALPSVHTQHAITELNSITNAKLTLLDIKLKKYQQKHLSSLIESVQFKKLNDMLDTANKARLESVSAPHASLWLDMKPTRNPHNILDPITYQTAMKLHLGVPLALPNEKCKYCNHSLDTLGHHALTCKKGGYVNTRHNTIRNTILGFTRQARITAYKEKGSHGSDRTRPADILMNPFGDLRSPQAVDVTIVSPLTIENLNSGAGNKGGMKGAVARAEEKKITLNTPACSRLGWDVWPFAVDSYGCFGEQASRLVGLLAKNISIEENNSNSLCQLVPFIYGSIQIALKREQGKAILGRGQRFSRWANRHNSILPQSPPVQLPSATNCNTSSNTPGSQLVSVNLQPFNPLNVIEPNPNSNRAYGKCYRALELYADSIGMRVVECGGAGDCLFLVFAFFMHFSTPESQAERRDLANIVRGLLFEFASTPRFRLEVTSEDVLTDDLLDVALQNLQESGAINVDGVLTIMQRYVKDSGISIKTHFASHENDRLNFPSTFGVRPADPYNQLEDQTSLWNFGNIAQGHWVALVPLNDQNDLRAQHMNPDPLVSVAAVSHEAPHVPTLPDTVTRLAGIPSEAVAVAGGEGVICSPAMDGVFLSDGQ